MGMIVVEQSRIRTATLADLDALQFLEATYFGEDQFSRSQLRHLISKAHANTYVLLFNNAIVGSATMVWRKGSRLGRLYSIVVAREAQGRGLGAKLLRRCESDAAEQNCDRISLEVRSDNKSAITLYIRHGYEIVGSLPGYYADGSNGLKMLKRLS
jgi:ribosomal-protein-alanine N-acetyltransferase